VRNKRMMATFIVDTSVFIYGYRMGGGEIVTVPGVVEELKDAKSTTLFEQAKSAGMRVEPAEQRCNPKCGISAWNPDKVNRTAQHQGRFNMEETVYWMWQGLRPGRDMPGLRIQTEKNQEEGIE